MDKVKRYKAVLTGRVQGVGLRMLVCEQAEKLGITGWVKNMADGTVNLEMQGDAAKLDELSVFIKKGNFIIKVEAFDAQEIPCVDGEEAFIIKY